MLLMPPRRRSSGGFTLLELLIGIVVTTFIVAAMTDGVGLVSEQVAELRLEADKGPDEVVALMTDMTRHGTPHRQLAELELADASRRTEAPPLPCRDGHSQPPPEPGPDPG